MKNYICPECKAINSTDDWNKETKRYSPNLTIIQDAIAMRAEYTYFYDCPACHHRSSLSDLVEGDEDFLWRGGKNGNSSMS